MAQKRFIAKNGIDNNSNSIINVANPTNAQDVATKAYTDGKYSTGGALGTPSSGTVTNLTGTASININGTVGATTPNSGNFSVAQVGVGSGAVALSINDGYGNANVCFNHFAGIPDNTSVGAALGSSARITSSVDSSGGSLGFQVGNATSSGVAVALTPVATMYTNGITSYVDVTATKFISNVATGTAPFTVTSTTPVTNLSIGGNAGTATTATNLSGGTVSATTGSFSGTMTLPTGAGINYIKAGTGDGASFTTYNLKINSWWGIGFGDYQDLTTVKAYIDCRSGNIGTSGVFVGNVTGTATTATNIAAGVAGSIPYQTAANTTAMTAAGTSGQVLTTVTTGAAPTWVTPNGGGNQRTVTTVIPTVGQTVFTIAYTVGYIDVFYNGIKLILADDFVATNGTSVTLTAATISGDVVEFVTYLNVALANTYTQPQANALFAPIASPTLTGTTTVTNLTYTGAVTGSTGILNIGSGQVYKDATGNVGIGTTAPTNKLTVNGGIDFSGSAFSGSGTGIWQQATNVLGFVTAGSTRAVINATGNVGIGTTSPAQKLSVAGTIESTTGGVKFPDGTTQTTAATAVTYATMLKFQ